MRFIDRMALILVAGILRCHLDINYTLFSITYLHTWKPSWCNSVKRIFRCRLQKLKQKTKLITTTVIIT